MVTGEVLKIWKAAMVDHILATGAFISFCAWPEELRVHEVESINNGWEFWIKPPSEIKVAVAKSGVSPKRSEFWTIRKTGDVVWRQASLPFSHMISFTSPSCTVFIERIFNIIYF